jgi:DNA polymerase
MKSVSAIRANAKRTADTSAANYLPPHLSLNSLRNASKTCEGCELYLRATQTVFGKGPAYAPLMLIGEVPGDQEDLQGIPFVGPAGKLLDEALVAAGTVRTEVYLTNAVKHFKWEARGKRRLHTKPSAREIAACRPWLEAEIEVVQPQILVCLGATAAQTLLGPRFRLTKHLGEWQTSPLAQFILATFHPSSVLRAPREADRHRMKERLIHDLRIAVKNLA